MYEEKSFQTGIIYNLLRKANSWDDDIILTTATHVFQNQYQQNYTTH